MFPHTLLFLLYNLVYILPVLYVHIWGFSQGGVEQIFNNDANVLSSMIVFYAVALFFYIAGSSLLGFGVRCKSIDWQINFKLPIVIKVLFFAVVLALVVSKILLYPEGVYSAYAFDSGGMSSRVWNISMGLSELGVLIFTICLATKNTRFALMTFLVVSLNLLHGTRIFTLILILIGVFYFVIVNKKISKFRLLIYLGAFFLLVVIAFLLVFIIRSNVSVNNINFDLLVSPVVYESLFNQISFIRMLGLLHQGMVSFAPHMLFADAAIFTLPSFSIDDKAMLMYINNFGELSPLGGLSGYASAIIYFSNFYFIWYFFLGGVSSLLLRATYSVNFPIMTRVIYIYFVCDTLFRFNRDPWFIVIKMLANNLMFLIFVFMIIAVKMRMEKRRVIQ